MNAARSNLTNCSHTSSSASEVTTLWRYINQLKFKLKIKFKQIHSAFLLQNLILRLHKDPLVV